MSPLLIFVYVILLELPILLLIRLSRKQKEREGARIESELNSKRECGARVLSILINARKTLEKRRLGGYKSYISSLIERCGREGFIDQEDAVTALSLTLSDLSRYTPDLDSFPESVRQDAARHYDYSFISDAIGEIEKMEGGE